MPLMLRGPRVGARDQDAELRVLRAGAPGLLPVHDPVVAVAHRARGERGEVRARAGLAEELAPDFVGVEERRRGSAASARPCRARSASGPPCRCPPPASSAPRRASSAPRSRRSARSARARARRTASARSARPSRAARASSATPRARGRPPPCRRLPSCSCGSRAARARRGRRWPRPGRPLRRGSRGSPSAVGDKNRTCFNLGQAARRRGKPQPAPVPRGVAMHVDLTPEQKQLRDRAAGLPREAGHAGRDGRDPRLRGRRPRVPPRAARARQGRLARRGLAEGIRRPRDVRDRAVHLRRGDPAHRLPAAVPDDQQRVAHDHALRHRRAEEALPAEDPGRRAADRDRLLRARGRHRPRVAEDARGARRQRVGDQRPEDLHQPRRPLRLRVARGAHQPDGREAPRHLDVHGAARCARREDHADLDHGRRAHQRDLLRGRARAARQPGRRREPGLEPDHEPAQPRARRALQLRADVRDLRGRGALGEGDARARRAAA